MVKNLSLMISANSTNILENTPVETLEFGVEAVLIPVFTCLGLVGNILSIKVLLSPGIDMKVKIPENTGKYRKTHRSSVQNITKSNQFLIITNKGHLP